MGKSEIRSLQEERRRKDRYCVKAGSWGALLQEALGREYKGGERKKGSTASADVGRPAGRQSLKERRNLEGGVGPVLLIRKCGKKKILKEGSTEQNKKVKLCGCERRDGTR